MMLILDNTVLSNFARSNKIASCLALAISRKHSFFTDDMAARKLANREFIEVSGSIGILISLIKMKEISLQEGNRLLEEFISKGYYSPVTKLDEFL